MYPAARGILIGGAFLLWGVGFAQESDKTGEVALKTVTYADLGKTIKDFKGKVVIVDFWQDTCLPCKQKFPHLVEQYQKHAADGLVAISVSLDDPNKDGAQAKALKFLQAQKAVFPNFILDEKPEVWQKKLESEAVPLVFVFDREGKAYKFPGETLDLKNVDTLVAELLARK